MACKHPQQGAPNHAPVRTRRHQGECGRKVPVGQQLTHTHPRSGSASVPWDQITHTFAVSMAATPVAQRRMGFKAPRAPKTLSGQSPHLASHGCIKGVLTYNWWQSGHWRQATDPLGSQGIQRAGVWPSARVSGLSMDGGPTWFPMDSAGGGGVNHPDSTMRETEGAELCPPNSASGSRHHAEV